MIMLHSMKVAFALRKTQKGTHDLQQIYTRGNTRRGNAYLIFEAEGQVGSEDMVVVVLDNQKQRTAALDRRQQRADAHAVLRCAVYALPRTTPATRCMGIHV